MSILAEIADKMPSTAGVVIACLVAAGLSAGFAWIHRAVAWTALLFTLLVGGFFAFGGYHESFLEGSFSDAVWSELGCSYVVATIAGPLLPVGAVAAVLLICPWRQQGRGFPLDGPPAAG